MDYSYLWAKARNNVLPSWHPLILHMLDVAGCADAILEREPETTRRRMAEILGLPWEKARPWLLLLVGCHDLGKACPGFQAKWDGSQELLPKAGLKIGPNADRRVHHAFVSQLVLANLLKECDWPGDLADSVTDAVGCHHGTRAGAKTLNRIEENRRAIGGNDWDQARRGLFDSVRKTLNPVRPPTKLSMTGPDFMLLAGLTSFADWIGSNVDLFPFGTPTDTANLPVWWARRRALAEQALDVVNWVKRDPLSNRERTFSEVFTDFKPRPLQEAVVKAVKKIDDPCLLLVEAPMGEGKTEAAFYAHLELQRRFGHRGLYVALPTKATGNAMFDRTLKFLRSFGEGRSLDLQLLHAGTRLNDSFQKIIMSHDHKPEGPESVRAAEWFTHKKKALLSEYGVGTVDQAILPILPVKHHFVRLWGLANRVVILDEIHAYDAYTGTLILHLLRWLLSLGSSVILLSATLPPSFRRKLAEIIGATLPESEAAYPRLSVFHRGKVSQTHFEADPRRRLTVHLEGIGSETETIKESLLEKLKNGGLGLALVNTVDRAQSLYRLFGEGKTVEANGSPVGKCLADGTEIHLFHGRFPADQRQKREEHILSVYGPEGSREGRKILIATQVAEQSLDLDFDVIATDLAPIDLVLQRAGRLWRHERTARPVKEPILLVAGLAGNEPPSFLKPLWWGKVYREDLLLRTWIILHEKKILKLPEEIDELVRIVYESEDLGKASESLRERMERAILLAGEVYAETLQAHQAIIGLPDDGSWKIPSFIRADEDEPGLHPSLVAATRIGEPSIVAIPIFPADGFTPEDVPDLENAKLFCRRSMSLSRQGLVQKLASGGVPKGWQVSPLLRNAFPLILDERGRWVLDGTVRLDDNLGLVFEPKEVS